MASSSSGLPLRQLRWPPLPAVDLLEECHWLVDMNARNANPTRKSKQFEEQVRHKPELPNEINNKEPRNISKQKSPYRRPLCRPKPPAPSPGSPAQRAAKSILKLKEGLLRLDGTNWPQDTCIQDDNTGATVALAQQPVSRSGVIKAVEPSLTTTSLEASRAKSPSPNRAKTPVSLRSPGRKKKRRPPTREVRELAEKQERLAAWLQVNPVASFASVVEDAGQKDDMEGVYPPYSVEVESRIESAMQCQNPLELGVRLWDDPVRSLLAAEMTSESVFGGAVPTRALAFQSPERASSSCFSQELPPIHPPPAKDEKPLTHEVREGSPAVVDAKPQLSNHAQKVFGTVHNQVADGAVADALATLEAGIRQSLSTTQAHLDAVSDSHGVGFNYSELALKCVTKLQLSYRARHRRRVNRLMLLQRQWRWWHARRRALKALQFANKQAMAIQRRYRCWYTHVTQVRSAVRIQRCFRMFESQKFLIRFQQICRLLLARQTRRRLVKTRIRIIGRIVFLFRKRRRQITLVQGLWRRRCAYAQLTTLLAHTSAVERDRRVQEDAFVGKKLDQARVHFREFLIDTKRGRELVRWQAEKPWLRFRRLRHNTKHWDELPVSEKAEAVARILPNRTYRGLQERALCQMLVGKNKQVPKLPKVLKVLAEELKFLAPPTVSNTAQSQDVVGSGCCPGRAGVRERIKRIRAKVSRHASTLWWTIATYPKEYCAARIWPLRKRRRDLARQQLVDDVARVLASYLRVWFRRIDSKTNTPPYACEWCSEPFATSREFYAHGKCAAARTRAEAEWAALSSDLQFLRRGNTWRFSKQSHDDPVRTDNYAFDLEAPSVRRLRRTRSHRKALRPLVATLNACTAGDSSNAVVPLDLAAFVLQYLDDSKNAHPLMQTAEHQLVRWSTLIGSMEVESSRQTPEGSGRESRWIRKDDLRSRLVVGSEWRGILGRWRRNLGGRALNYRPLPAANEVTPKLGVCRVDRVASKLKELQLRVRRTVHGQQRSKTAQQTLASPSAACCHMRRADRTSVAHSALINS
ncbi:hypothetical protein PC121_g9066 [Phytophthora cactorum]|nr:hypothetical protein PC120_g6920 [Phytophthora cactorum]KAG3071971.1 hypothetical protein PC121_g9066 [Phytophthora cactorum]